MATQSHQHSVVGDVPADIPSERVYDDARDAKLDEAMVNAIEQAEAAGKTYLARLLALELGSHYYETR